MQRISFNDGQTFWEYDTPKRLEEIKAFLARQVEAERFSPARCISKTLKAERAMYEPR